MQTSNREVGLEIPPIGATCATLHRHFGSTLVRLRLRAGTQGGGPTRPDGSLTAHTNVASDLRSASRFSASDGRISSADQTPILAAIASTTTAPVAPSTRIRYLKRNWSCSDERAPWSNEVNIMVSSSTALSTAAPVASHAGTFVNATAQRWRRLQAARLLSAMALPMGRGGSFWGAGALARRKSRMRAPAWRSPLLRTSLRPFIAV